MDIEESTHNLTWGDYVQGDTGGFCLFRICTGCL